MSTGSDVILLARDLISDAKVPYRHSDEKLVRHLNTALREALRIRPDLFYPNEYAFTDFTTGTVGNTLPIDSRYLVSLAEFVSGFTEASDDEFTLDGRAASLMQLFRNALLGYEVPQGGG